MSNRAEAWQVMMLTMNYCHKLVQEKIEELEKETPKRKILAKPAMSTRKVWAKRAAASE
jgi:hypothetical protein